MNWRLTLALALVVTASAGLGAVSTARADDDIDSGPRWSGFYLGVDVGTASPGVSFTHTDSTGIDAMHQSGSGGALGLEGGMQRQWGNVVGGLDVSFTDTVRIDAKEESPTAPTRTRESAVRELWAFTARLGYAHDNWMIFGKAGFATADIDQTNILTVSQAQVSEFKARGNGVIVGGGFEYALYPNVIFGSEYDWVKLSAADLLAPTTLAPGAPVGETDTGISADMFVGKARFIFKMDP